MVIYNRLLWMMLNLVCVGINIVEFFLVVRAVTSWKRISLLAGFNDAGKTLVDGYAEKVGRLWHRMTQKQLSLKGKLLIGFLLLEIIRIVATGFINLL